MSYADDLFLANCRDILENGVWDTQLEVRPRWADGTPAHTVKTLSLIHIFKRKQFEKMIDTIDTI